MENNGSGKCSKSRLSICAFSLASGLTWGLGIFALGMAAAYLKMGEAWVVLFASIYQGYDTTYMGSLIGGGWAFLDGLICGFVFVIIYNLIARMCPCSSCKSCCKE